MVRRRVDFARFFNGTVVAYYAYDDVSLNMIAIGMENRGNKEGRGQIAKNQAQKPDVIVAPGEIGEASLSGMKMQTFTDVDTGQEEVGCPFALEARYPF